MSKRAFPSDLSFDAGLVIRNRSKKKAASFLGNLSTNIAAKQAGQQRLAQQRERVRGWMRGAALSERIRKSEGNTLRVSLKKGSVFVREKQKITE